MSLFTAKRADGKAEWRLAYERFLAAEYGELVTLDELCSVLEVSRETGMERIYKAVARAADKLRKHNSRSVGSVPGAGYRVLMPNEHGIQAHDYQVKGRRRMKTAVDVLRGTNLSLLDDEERRAIVEQTKVSALTLQLLISVDRSARQRDALLAKALMETDERVTHLQAAVEQMKNAGQQGALSP